MQKPFKIADIDIDKINYGNIRGTSKKYINIRYDENRLFFQTPELLNINKPIKKNGYFELEIPLYGKSSKKVQELISFLNALDEKFIKDCKTNASTWFKNVNTVKYKSIIREIDDKNDIYENGILKLKIITGSNGTMVTNNGNQISPNELKPNTHIKMILECFGLWITNSSFGLYLRPILIDQREIKKQVIKFIEESDEDNILETEIENDDAPLDISRMNNIVIPDETDDNKNYININRT